MAVHLLASHKVAPLYAIYIPSRLSWSISSVRSELSVTNEVAAAEATDQ